MFVESEGLIKGVECGDCLDPRTHKKATDCTDAVFVRISQNISSLREKI